MIRAKKQANSDCSEGKSTPPLSCRQEKQVIAVFLQNDKFLLYNLYIAALRQHNAKLKFLENEVAYWKDLAKRKEEKLQEKRHDFTKLREELTAKARHLSRLEDSDCDSYHESESDSGLTSDGESCASVYKICTSDEEDDIIAKTAYIMARSKKKNDKDDENDGPRFGLDSMTHCGDYGGRVQGVFIRSGGKPSSPQFDLFLASFLPKMQIMYKLKPVFKMSYTGDYKSPYCNSISSTSCIGQVTDFVEKLADIFIKLIEESDKDRVPHWDSVADEFQRDKDYKTTVANPNIAAFLSVLAPTKLASSRLGSDVILRKSIEKVCELIVSCSHSNYTSSTHDDDFKVTMSNLVNLAIAIASAADPQEGEFDAQDIECIQLRQAYFPDNSTKMRSIMANLRGRGNSHADAEPTLFEMEAFETCLDENEWPCGLQRLARTKEENKERSDYLKKHNAKLKKLNAAERKKFESEWNIKKPKVLPVIKTLQSQVRADDEQLVYNRRTYCNPDLIVKHEEHIKFITIECKSSCSNGDREYLKLLRESMETFREYPVAISIFADPNRIQVWRTFPRVDGTAYAKNEMEKEKWSYEIEFEKWDEDTVKSNYKHMMAFVKDLVCMIREYCKAKPAVLKAEQIGKTEGRFFYIRGETHGDWIKEGKAAMKNMPNINGRYCTSRYRGHPKPPPALEAVQNEELYLTIAHNAWANADWPKDTDNKKVPMPLPMFNMKAPATLGDATPKTMLPKLNFIQDDLGIAQSAASLGGGIKVDRRLHMGLDCLHLPITHPADRGDNPLPMHQTPVPPNTHTPQHGSIGDTTPGASGPSTPQIHQVGAGQAGEAAGMIGVPRRINVTHVARREIKYLPPEGIHLNVVTNLDHSKENVHVRENVKAYIYMKNAREKAGLSKDKLDAEIEYHLSQFEDYDEYDDDDMPDPDSAIYTEMALELNKDMELLLRTERPKQASYDIPEGSYGLMSDEDEEIASESDCDLDCDDEATTKKIHENDKEELCKVMQDKCPDAKQLQRVVPDDKRKRAHSSSGSEAEFYMEAHTSDDVCHGKKLPRSPRRRGNGLPMSTLDTEVTVDQSKPTKKTPRGPKPKKTKNPQPV